MFDGLVIVMHGVRVPFPIDYDCFDGGRFAEAECGEVREKYNIDSVLDDISDIDTDTICVQMDDGDYVYVGYIKAIMSEDLMINVPMSMNRLNEGWQRDKIVEFIRGEWGIEISDHKVNENYGVWVFQNSSD